MRRTKRLQQASEPLSGGLRYPGAQRRRDRRDGRRDGKLGLPPINGKEAVRHTATTYVIGQDLSDQVAAEELQFEFDTAGTRVELHVVGQRLDAALAEQQEVVSVVAADENRAGSESLDRHPGEAALSEDIIRRRRSRERAEAAEADAAAAAELSRRITDLRESEARLAESVAAAHRRLCRRIDRLEAHALRRFGTYQQALIRTHPEGATVLEGMTVLEPRRPDRLTQPLTASEVIAACAAAPDQDGADTPTLIALQPAPARRIHGDRL